MSRLIAVPLTWDLCKALAPKVNPADSWECTREGYNVSQALAAGLIAGRAFAVVPADSTISPVGAFGSTCYSTIWSLWAPLTKRQSLQVLRETPDWVDGMGRYAALRSGPQPLWNYADPDNAKALEWLRATGSFRIDDHPTYVPGVGLSLYFEARRKAA